MATLHLSSIQTSCSLFNRTLFTIFFKPNHLSQDVEYVTAITGNSITASQLPLTASTVSSWITPPPYPLPYIVISKVGKHRISVNHYHPRSQLFFALCYLRDFNFTREGLIKWKSQIHTHKKASNYSAIIVDKDTTRQQRPPCSHLLTQLTCWSLADIWIIQTSAASWLREHRPCALRPTGQYCLHSQQLFAVRIIRAH